MTAQVLHNIFVILERSVNTSSDKYKYLKNLTLHFIYKTLSGSLQELISNLMKKLASSSNKFCRGKSP